MASYCLLNDAEKRRILAFSDVGLNRTEIAKKTSHPRKVVANFLRAASEYEIKKSGERLKLKGRGKIRITFMTSNDTNTLSVIRNTYCLIVLKTTFWKTLKANPFVR
uniref:HTH_Tnp_Tc3_1 domain-containing protein n=1 Tax=Heterorhabditis bacteriophora TaxID=37862 RepID=A0A1I7XFE4_HETBA